MTKHAINTGDCAAHSPLGRLHVGAGEQLGPLTVFPVWTDAPAARGIQMATPSHLHISELDEPQVPKLLVWHDLDTDLLLLEGTLLVGGWQTRVAASDVVVARGQQVVVDVRCVEQGRWGGGSSHGVGGQAPASVKAALRGGARRAATADQGEVWAKVSRLERSYGERPTSSLHQIISEAVVSGGDAARGFASAHLRQDSAGEPFIGAYPSDCGFADASATSTGSAGNPQANALEAEVLHRLQDYATKTLPGQRGVIIGIAGVPVSLDLFGTVAACRSELLPILTAALVDAYSLPTVRPTRGQSARDFAAQCMLSAQGSQSMAAAVHDALGSVTHWRAADDVIDLRGVRRTGTHSLLHASALNMKHELALAM